jgi:hypothetical protein
MQAHPLAPLMAAFPEATDSSRELREIFQLTLWKGNQQREKIWDSCGLC